MKILVLRFSSIGDIVLTTPVVRALARQVPGAEVHFATKPAYRGLLEANPYVARVHLLGGSLRELVQQLKAEKFDYVVDLHHNLRTLLITRQLGVKSSRFDKLNWQKWLLVNAKIDRLPRVHIVQRYLAAAAPLGVHDDGQGLDYFIPADQEIDLATLPAPFATGYVAVAIGAQHATKRLPLEKLVELCQRLAPRPVILLGGPEDAPVAQAIMAACTGGNAGGERNSSSFSSGSFSSESVDSSSPDSNGGGSTSSGSNFSFAAPDETKSPSPQVPKSPIPYSTR